MTIATLTVDINARLAGIQGDLGKVSRMAEQNAKRIEVAFSNVGSAIKGAFAGLGASLAAGFLTDIVQQVVDAQDALVDLSKSTAISVETLAGLGFAAKTTGGDLDSIAASINKLQVNIGKDPEKYKQLGIDAKNGYDAFKQLADIFVAIEDPEKRAAVAAEALGKAWAGAAPALSEGSKGFDALVEKGKSLSGVTAESAAAAAELNAKLDILKAKIGGTATTIVNNMVPVLDAMVTGFNDSAIASSRLVAQGDPLTETLRALVVVGGNVAFVFNQIGEALGGGAAQIAALGKLDLTLFSNIRESLDEGLKKNREEFDAWEKRVMNAGKVKINQASYSNEGRGRGIGGASGGPSEAAIKRFVGGSSGGDARAGSRAGKAIDDGSRLVEQLRDQVRATQDLTDVEKLEIAIADGKYKTATAGNLAIARSYAETLDAIKANKTAIEDEAEAHKKRLEVFAEGQRVFESVRTPAEALNAEIDRLLTMLDADAISLETFGRAASKAGEDMQNLENKTAETTDTLTEFARSAAQNMQSAFADFLFDPFSDGTESMAKKFGDVIKRMISEAASAEIMKRLFGDFGSKEGGNKIGGLVGQGLNFIGDLFKSANGNVFTSPGLSAYSGSVVTRPTIFPFASGVGLMGEAGPEAILPLSRDGSGKLGVRGGQNISVVINMAGGASAGDLRQAAGDIARRIGQTVSGAARYA